MKGMSVVQNKATPRRYAEELAEFWRTGDSSFIDRIFDSNYVQHVPGVPSEMDVKQILAAMRIGIPDFQMKIEDIVAEGDSVADRISWHGTHKGELMGILQRANMSTLQRCNSTAWRMAR